MSLHDSIRMPGALRWTDSPARAIAFAVLLSGLVVVGSLATWGLGDEGLLRMTRYTARLAFPFFLVAFSISAWARVFPSLLARSLLVRRRAIGLAFATAQGVHALAIVAYVAATPESLDLEVETIVGGSVFLWIGLMAASSNDAAIRALGRPLWRRFHGLGMGLIWTIYLATYLGRVAKEPAFGLAVGALIAALILRLVAWRRPHPTAHSAAG